MNHIAKRVVTALSTAAFFIGLFVYAPLWAVLPVLAALSCLVQVEFYQMAARRYEPAAVTGTLLGLAWLALTAAVPPGAPLAAAMPALLTAGVFAAAVWVLFSPRYKNPLGTLGITLLGFFYVPFMLSFFLRIIQHGASAYWSMPSTRIGLYTLLFIVAVTKISDMGGFAFGLSMGRHKMCPTISPNKSWEGMLGSVIGSCLIAALFCKIAQAQNWGAASRFWAQFGYPQALALGAAVAAAGTLGDLVESRFKRECGVKDSATFMPAGLGGFLDMFDSIIFVPALFYAALAATGTAA